MLDRRIEDLLERSGGHGWLLIDPDRNEAVAGARWIADHPGGGHQVELSVHPGWNHLLGSATEVLLRRLAPKGDQLWLLSDTDDEARQQWLAQLGAEEHGDVVLMARSLWRRQDAPAVRGAAQRISAVLDQLQPRLQPRRRSVPTPLLEGDSVQLGLNAADFHTARAVARAINEAKGPGTALARDGRTVTLRVPPDADERVAFLADVENLRVELATPSARVVINARTGSVVLNDAVTLGPCAVAHGSLSVTINSTPVVSQPNALSQGQTVVTEKTDISITQQGGSLVQMPAGTKLADVVKALNALGATPQDLLAILQAMRSAGALKAELEVI